MAEPQAYYFHSTLYAFSGAAVEAVIASFQRAINGSVAVKCFYDGELEVSCCILRESVNAC